MPIKGMTDKKPQLPTIGELRKGAPKKDGKIGRELDYFRFTSSLPDAVEDFVKAFGETPKQIPVYLPFHTVDENFEAWKEEWGASGIIHRCDGENTVLIRKPDGKLSSDPVPCPGKCKQQGYLKVLIPGLQRAALVTALTTSINDIVNIHSNLLALQEMNGGDLQGIPMILSRVEKMISVPNPEKPGARMRVKKNLLQIEAMPSWVQLQIAGYEQQLIATRQQLQLSAAPDDGEDEEIIGEIEPGPTTAHAAPVDAIDATDSEDHTGWTPEERAKVEEGQRKFIEKELYDLYMLGGHTDAEWAKYRMEKIVPAPLKYIAGTLETWRKAAKEKAAAKG